MEQEVYRQYRQDVELVRRVLVVQEVPGLPIGQPELVPQLQTLGRLTVADCDVPPPLPGSLEVPGPPTSDDGPVVPLHVVPLAAAVHGLVGQVDKLIVLHLNRR